MDRTQVPAEGEDGELKMTMNGNGLGSWQVHTWGKTESFVPRDSMVDHLGDLFLGHV